MRLPVIPNALALRPLAVAGSQPALARLAANATGSAIASVSRARSVNLALPSNLVPRAIAPASRRREASTLRGACARRGQRHGERRSLTGVVRRIAHRDRMAMSTFSVPFAAPLLAGTSQPEPLLS